MFTPCGVYVLAADVRNAVETAGNNGASRGLVEKALAYVDSKWSGKEAVDVMFVAEFIHEFFFEHQYDLAGCEIIKRQVCDPNLVPTTNPEAVEGARPDSDDFI